MVYDSIGTLFMNIGLFGGGIALGIAGLIFGLSRGMTKNSDMYAITFSAFAFLISMIIPNVPWALTVFLMGSIGLTVSFMPILKKMGDSNIFTIAIIGIIINLLLVFVSGAYNESLDWQTNIDSIESDIDSMLGTSYGDMNANIPDHGLCNPDDETCDTTAEKGSFNPLIFDVFASILAMGDYISKAIILAGMSVFAPFVIGFYLAPKIQLINPVIYWLVMIFANLINIAILYKIIAFILNKRGMK